MCVPATVCFVVGNDFEGRWFESPGKKHKKQEGKNETMQIYMKRTNSRAQKRHSHSQHSSCKPGTPLQQLFFQDGSDAKLNSLKELFWSKLFSELAAAPVRKYPIKASLKDCLSSLMPRRWSTQRYWKQIFQKSLFLKAHAQSHSRMHFPKNSLRENIEILIGGALLLGFVSTPQSIDIYGTPKPLSSCAIRQQSAVFSPKIAALGSRKTADVFQKNLYNSFSCLVFWIYMSLMQMPHPGETLHSAFHNLKWFFS